MTSPRTGNILVVYALLMHPLRSTVEDHLYALRRYSSHRVFYANLHAHQRVPAHLLRRRYDAIYFFTSFLSMRWTPSLFLDVQRWAEPLKQLDGVRVAVPQDEFLRTAMVCDFINDFDIDVVCSVAPPSEWPKIYPTVDRERVRFERVLTGYLDDRTVRRIEAIVAETPQSTVDVGYRAWQGAPWLGRHGTLKGEIAKRVEAAAPRHQLSTDISTRDEDTFHGDDWFRFMARCRYMIGVEGGASVLDLHGTFKECVDDYLARRPYADFEEIEDHCFAGEDGKLDLVAISPRHLEACATRTVQVLVRGDFNGILQAERHYIPLERDLSNLDEVLAQLHDEERRRRIAQHAYDDIVASGRYSYRRFVSDLEGAALGAAAGLNASASLRDDAWLRLNRLHDRLTWVWVAFRLTWHPRLATWWSRLLAAFGGAQGIVGRAAAVVRRVRQWLLGPALDAVAACAPKPVRRAGRRWRAWRRR